MNSFFCSLREFFFFFFFFCLADELCQDFGSRLRVQSVCIVSDHLQCFQTVFMISTERKILLISSTTFLFLRKPDSKVTEGRLLILTGK